MRLSVLASTVSLLACFAADAAEAKAPPPAPAPPAPSGDVAGSNAFAFSMYGALRGKSGNLFFSGTSLREALGLTYLGARGETAKEMSTVLRFDPDLAKVSAAAKAEAEGWNAARGASQLSVANRLWPDAHFVMKPSFVKMANDAYGAAVEPVDFVRDAEGARTTIDKWVSARTQDKIPELLPPGSLDGSTRLVITNAIYFKGSWQSRFEKSATSDEPFFVDGKTSQNVRMMHRTDRYAFAHDDGVKILELPYAKSDLAMDIVLPDAKDGLPKIEASLTPEAFARWTSKLSAPQEVRVSIPKTKFTWGGSVVDELTSLGIKRLFGGADLSGIADGAGLAVSDVVHRSFVAIDEEGTEAAAATGVVIRETAVSAPPELKADHPFVFFIRDVKRGRILFMGRVTNPGV
jgi:serpin B